MKGKEMSKMSKGFTRYLKVTMWLLITTCLHAMLVLWRYGATMNHLTPGREEYLWYGAKITAIPLALAIIVMIGGLLREKNTLSRF